MSWLRRSMKLRSCRSTRLAIGAGLAVDRVHADVDRPAASRMRGSGSSAAHLRACWQSERGGKPALLPQHVAIERAQADGEQALVLHCAIEKRLQAGALGVADRVGDRVGQRVGHSVPRMLRSRANQRSVRPIHQRQREIGGRDQRQHQRQQGNGVAGGATSSDRAGRPLRGRIAGLGESLKDHRRVRCRRAAAGFVSSPSSIFTRMFHIAKPRRDGP